MDSCYSAGMVVEKVMCDWVELFLAFECEPRPSSASLRTAQDQRRLDMAMVGIGNKTVEAASNVVERGEVDVTRFP